MSDDVVREFLVESNENLDTLDREFVQLEKDPANRDTLGSVFRTIHSIKGACGFLGFGKLESVAHVGENLLTRLRDGELTLNPEMTTVLLRMVDAIRQMLQSIEEGGHEGERHDEELKKELTRLQQKPAAASPPAKSSATAAVPPDIDEKQRAKVPARQEPPVVHSSDAGPPPGQEFPAERSSTQSPDSVAIHAEAPGAKDAAEPGQGQPSNRGSVSEGSIRVEVVLLNKLMNLVGELVLARNQILQFSNATEDVGIVVPSQQLNLLTTELQEGVMKTRMQPIGSIWSKFPRTVRDIAMNCGKQVRIEMEGKETELDKTIIEAIKDPLTHIVRNSVDHGIERPEVRVAAGKNAEGVLTLRAYHQDGQVNIEIRDDGAGLDHDKIKRKALERGLLSAERAAQLTEREAVNLIFLPGFSTAEKITNVSGRGVGMDVVKTNIEKIGGTVDVQAMVGAGTTVKMKIPLTLAIIPGLLVRAGSGRFVIPQVNLIELVRIEGDQASTSIEMVHGVPVYRLRGRLLPLVYLDRELKIHEASPNGTATPDDNAVNIVVLQAGGRQFGLIVDEIRDTEEIVVKPLNRRLKNIKTFAGATIMGDGKVALILDVLGLAQRASVITEVHDRAASGGASERKTTDTENQTFLVFNGPDEARMALPLEALARLEEFPASQVEMSGTQSVIQYRGQILPLIQLKMVLEERRRRRRHAPPAATEVAEPDSVQVLVCNHEGHTVGLIVEQILDIVEDPASVKTPATRAGVLYAAVIENHVTELLDLTAILHAAAFHPTPVEAHVEMSD
jgi:two-component system, chemotaxis family, sensor kinase CheA